ncbi:styrene monooxygenase NADH-dependent flavin reductase subunit StyB [uncultured Bradyrhizobium sp.]|uniref:styrene monooxygenase NADH-dependent flavin reductase subunit StyB n=1 Tax=uncultured Bradyrhizobium sp. TaxID=199684 RepID=UPI002630AD53|nr:flavin reductase family protein [uncultured Bradyrhizobium sp.]
MRAGTEMPRANPAAFREAASRFATGVTVLTALDEHGRVCGMTANSFVTVSLSPPTVLVSVMPGRMHRAISATGRYCVNVLPDHGRDLSRHFASQPHNGATPDYDIVDGLPRLAGCMAWFACEVTRHVDVSDHTLIIAEVSACDYRDIAPLVFFSSRYHRGAGAPVER